MSHFPDLARMSSIQGVAYPWKVMCEIREPNKDARIQVEEIVILHTSPTLNVVDTLLGMSYELLPSL